MSKDTPDSESSLFSNAMQGVKKLKQTVNEPYREPKKPYQPESKTLPHKQPTDEHLSDGWESDSVTAEQSMSYALPGIRTKVLRMLKRGDFALDAHLDLHGLTIEQARMEVAKLIQLSKKHGDRCVRIVHGKGYRAGTPDKPLLKNRVNHWLKQHPDVVAFHSAQPKHGGTGAVYVLLKSNRIDRGED